MVIKLSELCYIDTDSFILHTKTVDFFEDRRDHAGKKKILPVKKLIELLQSEKNKKF